MTIAMQPIYTQTASGSAYIITFNNIPQTFTDLRIDISARSGTAAVANFIGVYVGAYGGTSWSTTLIEGNGAAATSARFSNSAHSLLATTSSANATANTYSSSSIYIPNYAGSNFKSILGDAVGENNGTTGFQEMYAGLFRSTSPITTISIFENSGSNFLNQSTFSLYGITKG
jgi:hypothetical protein